LKNYSLPTSFKKSLGLISILVKYTVTLTQVREKEEVHFFFYVPISKCRSRIPNALIWNRNCWNFYSENTISSDTGYAKDISLDRPNRGSPYIHIQNCNKTEKV